MTDLEIPSDNNIHKREAGDGEDVENESNSGPCGNVEALGGREPDTWTQESLEHLRNCAEPSSFQASGGGPEL